MMLLVAIVLFIGINVPYTTSEPYMAVEKYTEKEPYTVVEYYTEKEPYTDTEYYTVTEPYNANVDVALTYELVRVYFNKDYLNNQTKQYATIKNTDTVVGIFAVTFYFDWNPTSISQYVYPGSTYTFEGTYSGITDNVAYSIAAGTKTISETRYQNVQKTGEVTKYRDVQKTRDVTKYQDVEKSREVIKLKEVKMSLLQRILNIQ